MEAVIGLPERDLIAGSLRNLADVPEWATVDADVERLLDTWDLGNPAMKAKRSSRRIRAGSPRFKRSLNTD
jgi:hypothetical protein